MREDTFRQITRLHLRHIKCCINNRSFSNRHASKHIHAHMFVWVCEHSPSNTSKRAQTHCQPIFQPSWKSHWLEHKTLGLDKPRASLHPSKAEAPIISQNLHYPQDLCNWTNKWFASHQVTTVSERSAGQTPVSLTETFHRTVMLMWRREREPFPQESTESKTS